MDGPFKRFKRPRDAALSRAGGRYQRDARHIAERLTHALSERIDRRSEGVICIQSEGRIVIVGGLFDEASQGGGDRPRDRLRANRREGPGGLQGALVHGCSRRPGRDRRFARPFGGS